MFFVKQAPDSGGGRDSQSPGSAVALRTRFSHTNSRISLRAGQTEYLLTLFPNGVNSRQNNFNRTTGTVLRFRCEIARQANQMGRGSGKWNDAGSGLTVSLDNQQLALIVIKS
jgi:hypothetical protein